MAAFNKTTPYVYIPSQGWKKLGTYINISGTQTHTVPYVMCDLTLINFYIYFLEGEHSTYTGQALPGSTFQQWVNSSYNTINARVESGTIRLLNNVDLALYNGQTHVSPGVMVNATDLIVSGGSYHGEWLS